MLAHNKQDRSEAQSTATAVRIERLVQGGLGMGRLGGEVVLVPLTAPGDLVEALEVHRSRGVLFAEPGQVLEPSPDRRTPPCALFGICGGCQLMHLDYPKQVDQKAGMVADTLARLGKVRLADKIPSWPSPGEFGWRHRARLHARGGRIGFFRRLSHSLVGLKTCPVLSDGINRLMPVLASLIGRQPAFPSVESFEVAQSPQNGEFSLFWQLKGRLEDRGREAFCRSVEDTFCGCGQSLAGQAWSAPGGWKAITGGPLSLDGGRSWASPGTFFQVNPQVNRLLVGRVLELLREGGICSLVDLYCGNGNFALAAASGGMSVLGVEGSPQAVRDARRAAGESARFLELPVEKFAAETPALEADALLVDPPRAGLSRPVRQAAERWKTRYVLYVSCNAASLARDLYHLLGEAYQLRSLEFFDMFPQSSHGEILAVLERRT